MAFGTDESVLFSEVSLIQGVLIEVPLYAHTGESLGSGLILRWSGNEV